jgi:hypothetical protein
VGRRGVVNLALMRVVGEVMERTSVDVVVAHGSTANPNLADHRRKEVK